MDRSQELTEPSTALNTYNYEDYTDASEASDASYQSDFEESPKHEVDAVGSYARRLGYSFSGTLSGPFCYCCYGYYI